MSEQQQHTSNKLTNKQTTHMATPPLGTVKPLQEGRKEGNDGKVSHIWQEGTFRAPKARSILNTSDG
jgi:hypothetical protein